MRIRRDIASIPVRSAKETWESIVDLVTGRDSVDQHQLSAAASIMESLIADERPATVPIVLSGCGPRVLIYCLYNEKAMEAGREIDALTKNPTAGDWRINAPCEEDDAIWMNKSLKTRAPRVNVYAGDRPPQDADDADPVQALKPFDIDWGAAG